MQARGEGWGRVTSYIWHSMDVRAEGPPFSARVQEYLYSAVYADVNHIDAIAMG